MEKNKFVEEVTIGGKNIRLEHVDLPLAEVYLDEDNPRLRAMTAALSVSTAPEDLVYKLAQTSGLERDIKQNGGLRERIIVQSNAAGKKVVAQIVVATAWVATRVCG